VLWNYAAFFSFAQRARWAAAILLRAAIDITRLWLLLALELAPSRNSPGATLPSALSGLKKFCVDRPRTWVHVWRYLALASYGLLLLLAPMR
jgi:hypothetical protein